MEENREDLGNYCLRCGIEGLGLLLRVWSCERKIKSKLHTVTYVIAQRFWFRAEGLGLGVSP